MSQTIDMTAECPIYTLARIEAREPDFEKWKLRNDMIERVSIQSCDHGFLSLGIDYKSGGQGVGYGYRSEFNIGLMILALADILRVKYVNGDILAAMKDKPIRVLYKADYGNFVAPCTYIGHFMEDRFVKMSELVMTGIVENKDETR